MSIKKFVDAFNLLAILISADANSSVYASQWTGYPTFHSMATLSEFIRHAAPFDVLPLPVKQNEVVMTFDGEQCPSIMLKPRTWDPFPKALWD
ncbi:MAG TPA: hypothetical protein V6C89_20680 [Drouetiella sp.]|jgi:hypothetical protein